MIKNIVILLFFCLTSGCYVGTKHKAPRPKRYLNIEIIPYNYNFYYYQGPYYYYNIPLRNHKKHNPKNNNGHHHGPRR